MQVNVRFLENLRLEASFDDFSIIADQPIRYKGDGLAPGPYDYFLASSALCAAYFVKVYCKSRNIPTEDIKVIQNNIVDPDNRYDQTLKLEIEIPEGIDKKDRLGMIKAMDRCTVKRVIQNNPEFIIREKKILGADKNAFKEVLGCDDNKTMIKGKDASLEDTINNMSSLLADLGINIEIASWRNPVPHVWSVHIRDADSPICYTNGKGTTKAAALASALGEYIERISNNYFYNDYYLGKEIANFDFVHYRQESWFKFEDDEIPFGLMDDYLKEIYNPNNELKGFHLIDTNSGNIDRGICAIPFIRQSDKKEVYIPVNLVGNLFVSNGMSAGNSKYETRVQCLSEIFERAVKKEIILNEYSLPDVPESVLKQYSSIIEGIHKLEQVGFSILVKDASLGGKYPVICVTLMNPNNGGVFASFGAHPRFEIALERTLTELLQGRSFEGMNDLPVPTFNTQAIKEDNNIVEHFIDSTGVVSWKFFSKISNYKFVHWNFSGSTEEEYNYLMGILNKLDKEVYIADYNDLGAHACRILVPNYSEIYEVDDLIWDNNNRALEFRDEILNIHHLDNNQLSDLVENLEESEIDNYTNLSELIGVAFEEASVWGQADVGQLKSMIYLALKKYDHAKEYIEMFLTFNDNTSKRRKYHQVLKVLLDIELDKGLNIDDYKDNLCKMFSVQLLNDAIKTINGEIRFYGLTKTNSNLDNLEKHQRLIKSYKKLIKKRANSPQREA